MKIAIRKNVFETNSSSTHSLSFVVDSPREYTFECDSAWSRMIMLKALINNATTPSEKNVLTSFYNECSAVFSEKEKVEIELIPDYLGLKLIERRKVAKPNEHLKNFLKAYDTYNERLCSFVFRKVAWMIVIVVLALRIGSSMLF